MTETSPNDWTIFFQRSVSFRCLVMNSNEQPLNSSNRARGNRRLSHVARRFRSLTVASMNSRTAAALCSRILTGTT